MQSPSCSVVIPSYNAVAYLPAAIASIEAQAVRDIEVLVFDDGSTDGTAAWLAQAQATRPWLRIFIGGGHGPARARNFLIEKANSDLVAFLDADDVWYAGKLAPQIAFHAAHPDCSFTFTDYRHIDVAGASLGGAFEYWQPGFARGVADGFHMLDDPLSALLACNVAGTSTVVAKSQALQNANGFDEALPSAEDWDLWLRLAATGGVAFSAAVTTDYLVRPGSETANRASRIRAMQTILSRHAHKRLAPDAMRKARAQLLAVQAEEAAISGRMADALGFRLAALVRKPDRRNALEATAAALRFGGFKRTGEVAC